MTMLATISMSLPIKNCLIETATNKEAIAAAQIGSQSKKKRMSIPKKKRITVIAFTFFSKIQRLFTKTPQPVLELFVSF